MSPFACSKVAFAKEKDERANAMVADAKRCTLAAAQEEAAGSKDCDHEALLQVLPRGQNMNYLFFCIFVGGMCQTTVINAEHVQSYV